MLLICLRCARRSRETRYYFSATRNFYWGEKKKETENKRRWRVKNISSRKHLDNITRARRIEFIPQLPRATRRRFFNNINFLLRLYNHKSYKKETSGVPGLRLSRGRKGSDTGEGREGEKKKEGTFTVVAMKYYVHLTAFAARLFPILLYFYRSIYIYKMDINY